MQWRKLGLIFCPAHPFEWMASHAANPFAKYLGAGIFRVYFTCRNPENQSYIGYVDIDFTNAYKIVGISTEPVLSPGEVGLFDDSGVAMSFLLDIEGVEHLYYLGWNLKVTVPWLNTIGLAIWNSDKQQFIKTSRAPMMDRSEEDPFSISYPCIVAEAGRYKMWYGSNLSWGRDQSAMQHVIKYAESQDGRSWVRNKETAVGLLHPQEYALSKPFVLVEDNLYKMWYSYRANGEIQTYRIGYAESQDGCIWERKDGACGIDVSKEGWDSEMIEYPFIFDYDGNRYMLYNGNGYGRTGFGLAILEKT